MEEHTNKIGEPSKEKGHQNGEQSTEASKVGTRRESGPPKFCHDLLREMFSKKHSAYAGPFYKPVDVKKLGLLDYHEIVKTPMDLETVKHKLENKEYGAVDEFENDVMLIFSNCFKYNPPGDEITAMAKKLEQIFVKRMAQMKQEDEAAIDEEMEDQEEDEVQSEMGDLDADAPSRTSKRLATRTGRRMEEQLRARALKDSYSARNWRQFEKNQLYNGLRQYGSKKWRKVSELVHTKSDPVVKAYINREKRNQNYIIQTTFQRSDGTEVMIDDGGESKKHGKPFALIEEREDGCIKPEGKVVEKLVRRNKEAPMERWLEVIQSHDSQSSTSQKALGNPEPCNYSSVLPTSLNWIADNEKHPDPATSGNVDYAEIYRYLACICEGEAPPELNMETAQRVSQLMPDMAAIVRRMEFAKESKFLENYRGQHTGNTYRPEATYDPRTKSAQNVLALNAINGLNPLGLHPEIAVDRIVPFKDDKKEIPEQ